MKKDIMINIIFFFLIFLFLIAFLPRHQLDSYQEKNEGFYYFNNSINPKLDSLTYLDFKLNASFTQNESTESSISIVKKNNISNLIYNRESTWYVQITYVNETLELNEYFSCNKNFSICNMNSPSYRKPSKNPFSHIFDPFDWIFSIRKIDESKTFTDKINNHDVECQELKENVNLILGYSHQNATICLEKNTNFPIKGEITYDSKFKDGVLDSSPEAHNGKIITIINNYTVGLVSESDILKPILIDKYEYSHYIRTNATINLITGEIIK